MYLRVFLFLKPVEDEKPPELLSLKANGEPDTAFVRGDLAVVTGKFDDEMMPFAAESHVKFYSKKSSKERNRYKCS